jgi:hypothetical protein
MKTEYFSLFVALLHQKAWLLLQFKSFSKTVDGASKENPYEK